MATPNYGYEKRQRELAKRKKKEEKLKAKSERKHDDPATEGEPSDVPEGESPASSEDGTDGADGAGNPGSAAS